MEKPISIGICIKFYRIGFHWHNIQDVFNGAYSFDHLLPKISDRANASDGASWNYCTTQYERSPFLIKIYRFQKALYYPYSIHNDSYFPLVQNAVLVLERLVEAW
jgi:hypothetical protein